MDNQPCVLLLSNVGGRDVKLKDQVLQPYRTECDKLIKEWDATNIMPDGIEAQLLEPLLYRISSDFPGAQIRLVLFSTNQGDSSPKHNTDTDLAAKLIVRMFPSLLDKFALHKASSPSINIIDKDPSNYDFMLDKYGSYIKDIEWQEGQKVILNNTGSTQAMNFGFTIHALDRWGEDIIIFHFNETTKRPERLRIPSYMGEMRRKLHMREFLILRLFKSLHEWLEKSPPALFPEAAPLSLAAHYLKMFDVERAIQVLEDNKSISKKIDLHDLVCNILPLLKGDDNQSCLIRHLFEICKQAWEEEDNYRFLSTLFSGLDRLLGYVIYMLIDIPPEPERNRNNEPDWEKWRINFDKPELLPLKTYIIKKLNCEKFRATQLTQEIILRWCRDNLPDQIKQDRAKLLLDFFTRIERIKNLRNISPTGHGFGPLSRKEIDSVLARSGKTRFATEELDCLLDSLGLEKYDNPMVKIGNILKDNL